MTKKFVYSFICISKYILTTKKNHFLLYPLVAYLRRNNEITLNSDRIVPMLSRNSPQHQCRSKSYIINQDNDFSKRITKNHTEFTSSSGQIFTFKVDIHNTFSGTSKNYRKLSRLFSEHSLDLDSEQRILQYIPLTPKWPCVLLVIGIP